MDLPFLPIRMEMRNPPLCISHPSSQKKRAQKTSSITVRKNQWHRRKLSPEKSVRKSDAGGRHSCLPPCDIAKDLIYTISKIRTTLLGLRSVRGWHETGFILNSFPHQPTSGNHTFILAATDYFSKWAEAVPLKSVTGSRFHPHQYHIQIWDPRILFSIQKRKTMGREVSNHTELLYGIQSATQWTCWSVQQDAMHDIDEGRLQE